MGKSQKSILLVYIPMSIALLFSAFLECTEAIGRIQYIGSEDAGVRSNNCTLAAANEGYTGSGYLNFNWQGSWAEWDAELLAPGVYEVEVRYAAANSRPADLLADGRKVGSFSFASTHDLSLWETESLDLEFSEGYHTFRIFASNSMGPNIDWILIRPKPLSDATVISRYRIGSVVHQASNLRGLTIVHSTTVLESGEFLSRGDFVFSDSGQFKVGFTNYGDLVLLDSSSDNLLWSAGIRDAYRCFMQTDGNLVVRDINKAVLWASHTSQKPGARFIVNSDGFLAIIRGESPIWMTETSVDWTPVEDTVVLEPHSYLSRGDFVSSPSGSFQTGLSESGDLIVVDRNSNIFWSANISGGYRCYMQRDGNLLIRDQNLIPLWASQTSANNGARLILDDTGTLSVELGSRQLWLSRSNFGETAPRPEPQATSQHDSPGLSPGPPSRPTNPGIEQDTVLAPGDFLSRGEFVFSPSGSFKVGLTNSGDFVLRDSQSNLVWSAGLSTGYRCFMQADGNLIVRDSQNFPQWGSATGDNEGARLVIDDGGQIAVMQNNLRLWIEGLPRGAYQTPDAAEDLQFPIRGAFYYPWYPETWTVNDQLVKFQPMLGYYSSSDPSVAEAHIDMLEYAYVDLSIASWWGPGENLDKARISLMMDETVALNSTIKWTVYHEDEYHSDNTPAEIKKDLDYLRDWFAWHPAWAHIDRRPVIFVYNDAGCDVANRWMAASQGEWYVVLKLFRGFLDCPTQPDSWHQYGPADAEVRIAGYSYSISPGFWRADSRRPLLERQSRSQWRSIVENMVNSQEPWQLITTFNEAGE
jgi:hypothetical protein